jgi:hypothetical protein
MIDTSRVACVAYMGDMGNSYRILVVKPEMKIPFKSIALKRIRQDTVVSAGFNWLWAAPICILV